MSRLLWMSVIFAAFYIGNSSVCRGETLCPWMNATTAGGFLGGVVKPVVSDTTVNGDATCDFTVAGDSNSMLRIAVHTLTDTPKEFPTYLALCGVQASALKGIGNEAVQCTPTFGATKSEQLIVGRVRNRVFIITLKAGWIGRPPSSPTKTRNPISDNSENIAEQVAGAMF